ncbi:MAG: Glycosyltransferase involved in cell wall biogenesis-like protein [Candidatus Nomurabacteria bacterium GW2011_GWE1_35_16]|uniref:Glycosyltransferase involved in cell wall biogenesis-like protein n=1 Tax=Candidatus Nomurabacteria bacterium GW2011_GWE1_35_16 TaxID=1618761 RepID=A0A0G0EDW9_9BACT|nr:MAG: Glycosyltransferase involved in cell wall biogenesis-like protein [Candidatus Nomurabacteria bacterium GW2011_GWE1_35_16]
MTLLSIALPVYEMQGRGVEMLQFSLQKLRTQTFSDFEVVISDNSADDDIWEYVESQKRLNIKYVKNKGEHTLSGNVNNAFRNSSGDIIHLMCQDDYFYDNSSLQKIVNNFDANIGWMTSMYMHTNDRVGLFKQQIPRWNDQIYFINTIGTPSCLTFLNGTNLYFDKDLKWFVDCEFYWQLYKKYGEPKILKDTIFIQYLWEGQTTQTITQELVDSEMQHIKNKYMGEIN